MRWISLPCSALLFLASPRAVHGQTLTQVENKLAESINAAANDQVASLQKVVDIDSGTLNAAGVREVGRYFETELQALGFRTRWVSMPDAMHRAGHLVAERTGPAGRGKRVLLLGHLDTVFEGQGHRFQRAGDHAKGAGTMDMKGGDIVILYALKALQQAKLLDGATVRVILTGDEENIGLPTTVARRDVVETARQSDVVLSFEPDSGKTVIGRRGLSTWLLQISGVQGHSALVLRAKGGAGAIYEASRILDEIRRAYTGHPTITINPGLILGGTEVSYDETRGAGTASGKFNIVAPSVSVRGDLRFLSDAERDGAKARLREIAAANLPKTTARIDFEEMAPGWPASAANQSLLSEVGEISRALGMGQVEAEDPVNRGFGDINFIGSSLGGIDGLGPRGDGFHSPDETIDLNSLGKATSRAAVLIYRLTHPPRS